MGSLAENKLLARRWFDEVINGRRIEAIDEIYAEGHVHHSPGGRDMGREQAKQFAASTFPGSPGEASTTVGICISRIVDGQFVEDWELADRGAGDFSLT